MIQSRYQAKIDTLLASGQRKLLGIVGPPGSGKSTLAQQIQQLYPQQSVVVPMDGYHLANCELARLGKAARKGAEDTFDSAGFAALIQRLKTQPTDETIYAPEFRRAIEEPIANAIPIQPQHQLIIVEGNYLLLESGHWAQLPSLLDETWYVDVGHTLRESRLIQRHIQFGRSEAAAIEWVQSTDGPNARLIEASKSRADLLFTWE
ncbi:nucleoside/nucleotide kinase family protein [Iodobacter fluviatilis]|uniref:ABC transporter family protein n=1 Tax=Iodobacter fluviatilis TaxID=537 RepID=A0A377SWP9_9NEIS|nr:nucleoside/nucleotide kinase family protein [Iodobacter fluviatilis]TCU85623.1 ABC transporter family protein [Iodobacter fluviatilis]STR44929.1 Uridine kinase [Iodobacter fluviatilis]